MEPDSPERIRLQIAALQAELYAKEASKQAARPAQAQPQVLVGKSPSPKKRQPGEELWFQPTRRRLFDAEPVASSSKVQLPPAEDLLTAEATKRPSKFLKGIDKSRHSLITANERREVPKSTSFTALATVPQPKPARQPSSSPEPDQGDRDDSLRLVESLELGPKDFKPPTSDPDFSKHEPNSRIRLKPGSRVLSHDLLQDYLDARYHVSPSLLYSIVRPGRGNDLEVPLEADFVVIGVLAEKSAIKMVAQKAQPAAKKAKPKSKKGKEAEDWPAEAKADDALDGHQVDDQIAADDPNSGPPQKQRRYVSFKVLDMRLKRDELSSAGDSMLNMIMFESESSTALMDQESDDELVDDTTGARMRKVGKRGKKTQERVFRGGSGGAYERFWKEQDGTVVAILNPRVMKPRPAMHGQPPSTVITITPDSADSIVVIVSSVVRYVRPTICEEVALKLISKGRRISDACDFHVQNALQKTRSGRSELMVGTSSLTRDVGGQLKRNGGLIGRGGGSSFDPVNKTGLLPRDGIRSVDGQATYVVKPAAPPTARSRAGLPPRQQAGGFAARREKEDLQDRQKRKEAEERTLFKVLKKDDGKSVGAKYLSRAAITNGKPIKMLVEDGEEEEGEEGKTKKRRFNASTLRAIGFDPTAKDATQKDGLLHLDEDSKTKKRRMDAVSSLGMHGAEHVPKLGHAPSYKKSNVVVPEGHRKAEAAAQVAPEEDEDDLVILPAA